MRYVTTTKSTLAAGPVLAPVLSAAIALVMAVSQDRKGLAAAEPFYREQGLDNLEIFLDPKGDFARAMGVAGLPTTLLLDDQGRIVGALEGPLEWDGPEAVELIRFYLARRPTAGQPATEEG